MTGKRQTNINVGLSRNAGAASQSNDFQILIVGTQQVALYSMALVEIGSNKAQRRIYRTALFSFYQKYKPILCGLLAASSVWSGLLPSLKSLLAQNKDDPTVNQKENESHTHQ